MRPVRKVPVERIAALAMLGLLAMNLAVAGRWAGVPGALRGWRWPYLAGALVVTALLAFRPVQPHREPPRWLSLAVAGVGGAVLAVWLLVAWFPPSTWRLIPFFDDWPPRFASTVDGVHLLTQGTFVGWQWNLLGGYSTATDITQSLTLLGAIPMILFGDAAGFHLLHIALFCALPLLVFLDIDRAGSRGTALLAAGFVALSVVGHGWFVVRSGDTNSLAGLFAVMVVLAASRRARARACCGFTGLVAALSVAAYAHVGFFLYSVGLLAVEALYYREPRHLLRGAFAAALAFVVSLPLTYELVRYPGLFVPNNVMFEPPAHVDWSGVLRKVFYNIEILFDPSRWFNDAAGLTSVALPILIVAAWRHIGRTGFYAWCALFAVVLTRFNVPEAGYVFIRPVHLLAIFTPVALAGFVAAGTGDRWLAAGLAVVVALCFQIVWFEVPHRRSVSDFVPELVHRLGSLDGNLVVVENNPHRDVAAGSGGHAERSLYGTHYEALLPAATGKRLYAGFWDGWQWTPSRGEMLAAGAWKGRMISAGDEAPFIAELTRWGARHVLVWSETSRRTFSDWPGFASRWRNGPWEQFSLVDAHPDVRSVVTEHGTGEIVSTTARGGVVRLAGVRRGDHVTVRTRFHPAWTVVWASRESPAVDAGGQLGFLAPADGTYDVTLSYPARRWLLLVSVLTLIAAGLIEHVTRRRVLDDGRIRTA
jgi:hypothetical protein